jgi:hypothetical protein
MSPTTIWMRREKQAHNPQARPGADGGEHLRIPIDILS